jgi:hypothetical protein
MPGREQPRPARQPKTWIVDFDSDAVIDFEDVKSRGERKAVFNVASSEERQLDAAAASVLGESLSDFFRREPFEACPAIRLRSL